MMIRPKLLRLKSFTGLPRYYLVVVKLALVCGLLCILVQPFIYTPIHYTFQNYWEKVSKPEKIPEQIIKLVSPQNASKILDEKIDIFRARNRTEIPKIIHQIYASQMIPDVYVPLIQSWVKNHPDYEYWLWDDESSRMLVEKYYTPFLPLFDAYCHDLFRSDVTRYFLLHKFGGWYMDMDYINYKNMESLISDKQCLVVEENKAQSKMIYRVPDMIMNAWMGCVPDHPYLDFLVNMLPSAASCYFHDVLTSTGPLFIYKARKTYTEITRCNILESCYVHILPSDKMMKSWDPDMIRIAKKHCMKNRVLTPLQIQSCKFFESVGFSMERSEQGDAYADHLFLHIGNLAKEYKAIKRVHIRDIVPKAIIPSESKL